MRYGNFAGPGYAGGLGSESTITHPDINKGQPILASVLTQTPEGLASFMKLALKTEPNGYLDGVTRNHDVEYTVAEMRFFVGVQAQFGKLPHELTAQDRQAPAFGQLETARDAEYWRADQRMLTSMAKYQPTDFVDSAYRDAALTAFYVKAESGVVGYGLGEEVNVFYRNLKTIDAGIGIPSLGQSLSALGDANALARSDFEALATLPITPQERQFFNSHLKAGQWLNSSAQNADGSPATYDSRDSTNRVVVPELLPDGNYGVRTQINGDTVTMILDRRDPLNPVFTRETTHNGQLVSVDKIRPTDVVREGEIRARTYESVRTDGTGQVLEIQTIAKPDVPDLSIPPDLQQKIDAVKSGNVEEILKLPVLHSSATNPDSTALADAALEQLKDAFSQIDRYSKLPGVQYADASNGAVLSDAGGGSSTAPHANPGHPQDLLTFLDGPGASLTPAQQYILGTQLGSLGLGAVDGNTLSLHSLPGGGALLANAEGDIVGELSVSSTGVMRLQANTVNADGTSTPVDLHVCGDGQAMTHADYQLSQTNAALNLIQGLDGLQHWDKLNDLGRYAAALGLANSLNTLSDGALGNLGALNTVAGGINLAQSLENGNLLGTLASINSLSDLAIDRALNTALGSTGVPYVGTRRPAAHRGPDGEQGPAVWHGLFCDGRRRGP